jgi:hypothetical protein
MKLTLPLFFLLFALQSLPAQMTMEKLDDMAVFSFAIMSDNKGYSVEEENMYKCDQWIREGGDRFILGLGDHVKDNRTNPFLNFIKNDSLWHNHFYPNVADGENEFWGKDQADWGSGSPILEYVDLSNRKNVEVRENKCEYYAVETYDGIRVHIIQLHFSDSPSDPDLAFTESSRKYLMDVLDGIKKTKKDIIVVLAHTGPWFDLLSKERRSILIKKADLLLGATTHVYKRYIISDNENAKEALALNTGAVANSRISGYLEVHILKKPMRIIVQYQLTDNNTRELQKKGYAYEKLINGKIKSIDWNSFKH